jgi:uncharacterized protein DUF3226
MSRKLLLVEGIADSDFYRACLRKFNIRDVEVKPPQDLGRHGNGLGNVVPLLPVLLPQLIDGRLDRLGIVVDADYKHNNVGHATNYRRITSNLEEAGYHIPRPFPKKLMRYVFSHKDGLPDIGLWIMPDNNADGMLEHLISNSITTAAQLRLLKHAQKVVSELPNPLFDDKTHRVKAEISTWLAWQRVPGKGLASTVGNNLIDLNCDAASKFGRWLEEVFR